LETPWDLYLLYGVLVGIGFSTHDVITLSTVARWFVRRRGIMSGLVKVGTGTGQLVVPLIATVFIAAYGWRKAYLIIGVALLMTLLAAAQALRRDPEGMGLLPDGGGHQGPDVTNGQEAHSLTLSAAARKGPFWIICVAEFAIFFCLLTIIIHIVPHATDLALHPVAAAGVLATIGGVSMLGRIVMGVANDRLGGKRSLILCFVILICGLLWLQVAREAWMLFLFAAVYGFAHGGFFTVMSPTVAEFFGTGSHGLIFGIVLFSGTIGGAFGPIIAGTAFDLTGSYRMVFLMLAGLAALGLALITLLRPIRDASAADQDLRTVTES
jgi:MFS family permease